MVSLGSLNLVASPNTQKYVIQLSVTAVDPLQITLDSLIDGVLGESTYRLYGIPHSDAQLVAMSNAPDMLLQKNMVQSVVNSWEYQCGSVSDLGLSLGGSRFPQIDFSILSSNPDMAEVQLMTNLTVPSFLPLSVYLGNMTAIISYSGSKIISAIVNNSMVTPGANSLMVSAQLHAEDVASRSAFESFMSKYAFGLPVDQLMVTIGAFDSSFFLYGPLQVDYMLSVPSLEEINLRKTVPVPCVDTLALIPGVDISTIQVLPRLVPPSCKIDGQLGVWFHNPLPIPITLTKLDVDVFFSDQDGLVGFPWIYIQDAFPQQFGPAAEIPLVSVHEPGGSSSMVVPCLPPSCWSKRLPVVFQPDEYDTLIVVLRTDPLGNDADVGLWNTCIRLAEEYYNNKLQVNMKNARVSVKLQNFELSIAFSLTEIDIGTDATCRQKLGLQATTPSPN